MTTCKNCGHQFELEYCNKCGQKASVKRIELKWLLYELPHAIWHIEKGFLYNFKQLFKRPGQAINDFLEGKRKPFFNPLTYLVLLMFINYVVMWITDFKYYDETELLNMSAEKAKEVKGFHKVNWWIVEHSYYYMLIAIPVVGIFLFLLLRTIKKKYNIAETTIMALFITAQCILIQSIIYFITGWVRNGEFIRTVDFVTMCLWALYNSFTIYQVINPGRLKFVFTILSLAGGGMMVLLLLRSAFWVVYLKEYFAN